jgi:hypothetical protein
MEQFLDAVEDDGEAALDGSDTESGGEMTLADAWRPEQKQGLPVTDPLST